MKILTVRSQVLVVVSMKMAVFWVFAPCSLVGVYQTFQRCLLNVCNLYQITRRTKAEHSHLQTVDNLGNICKKH
jgi:hypothetical protein